MDVHEVHDLARNGQVVKAPNYHPGKRGIPFQAVLVALERCYHVAKDIRESEDGKVLHQRGWYALSNLPHKRRLRVDFDVHQDRGGTLLLVVTAYHV